MKQYFLKIIGIIIGVSIAVIIWLSGIFIGQEQTITILNPEGALGGLITRVRSTQVSTMFDYGNGRIKVYPEVKLIYSASALDLLKKIKTIDQTFNLTYKLNQNTGNLADLAINHYQNTAAGKKWQAWLNNIQLKRDISQVKLKTGDIVEFKYIKLIE